MSLPEYQKVAQVDDGEETGNTVAIPMDTFTQGATPSGVPNFVNYLCVVNADENQPGSTRYIRAQLGRSMLEVVNILAKPNLFHELIDVEPQRIAVSISSTLPSASPDNAANAVWVSFGDSIDVEALAGLALVRVELKESAESQTRRHQDYKKEQLAFNVCGTVWGTAAILIIILFFYFVSRVAST